MKISIVFFNSVTIVILLAIRFSFPASNTTCDVCFCSVRVNEPTNLKIKPCSRAEETKKPANCVKILLQVYSKLSPSLIKTRRTVYGCFVSLATFQFTFHTSFPEKSLRNKLHVTIGTRYLFTIPLIYKYNAIFFFHSRKCSFLMAI